MQGMSAMAEQIETSDTQADRQFPELPVEVAPRAICNDESRNGGYDQKYATANVLAKHTNKRIIVFHNGLFV